MVARGKPGNPYERGRLSTVDLLMLTSLDQLNTNINFFLQNINDVNEEVNSNKPSPSVRVPWSNIQLYKFKMIIAKNKFYKGYLSYLIMTTKFLRLTGHIGTNQIYLYIRPTNINLLNFYIKLLYNRLDCCIIKRLFKA